jgi:hypothetical protein
MGLDILDQTPVQLCLKVNSPKLLYQPDKGLILIPRVEAAHDLAELLFRVFIHHKTETLCAHGIPSCTLNVAVIGLT